MAITVFRVYKKFWSTPVIQGADKKPLLGRLLFFKNDYILRVDTSNASEMTNVINTLVSCETAWYPPEAIDSVDCYMLAEGEKIGLDTAFQRYRVVGQARISDDEPTIYNRGRVYSEVQSALNVTRHYITHFRDVGTSFRRRPTGLYDANLNLSRIGAVITSNDLDLALGVSFNHTKGPRQIQFYRGGLRPEWYFHSKKGSMMLNMRDDILQSRWKQFERGWKFLFNHLTEYYLDENDTLRVGYHKCSGPHLYCATDFSMCRKREASKNAQECQYSTVMNILCEKYYAQVSLMEKHSHEYGCNTCLEFPPAVAARLALSTLRLIKCHLKRSFHNTNWTYPELKFDLWRFLSGNPWNYKHFQGTWQFTSIAQWESYFSNNYDSLIVCDSLYLDKGLERLDAFIDYFENLTAVKNDLMISYTMIERFGSFIYAYSESGEWTFPKYNFNVIPPRYPAKPLGAGEPTKKVEISTIGSRRSDPYGVFGGQYPTTVDSKKPFYEVFENDWQMCYKKYGAKVEKEYPGMMESMIRGVRVLVYFQENIKTSHVGKKFPKGCLSATDKKFNRFFYYNSFKDGMPSSIFPTKPLSQNPGAEGYSVSYQGTQPNSIPLFCATWDYDRRDLFHDCTKKKKDDDDDDDDGEEDDDEEEEPEEEEEEPEEEEDPDNPGNEIFDNGEGENDYQWDEGFAPCEEEPEERKAKGHPTSRMRAWDNTIHPLTRKESNAEQREVLEQMEENGKKAAHASYDIIAKVLIPEGVGVAMVEAAPESHYLINNTLGQINPCDNLDQLKKDTTEYVVDRATGGAEKFLTGGGLANLRGLHPSGAPTSWKAVEEGGAMYLKPPKRTSVEAVTNF